MRTVFKSQSGREVVVAPELPTVLIGERINPSGGARKRLTRALVERNADYIQQEAIRQIEAGADLIDINVQAADVQDEPETLAWAVETVAAVVDAPISIDTNNPDALKLALQVTPGRALINSVSGEERSLNAVLPLAAEYNAAVIGLTLDDNGIPTTAEARLAVARALMERAASYGLKPEDILIDTLTMSVGADHRAASVSLNAMRMVREELGVNLTAGASNVSFGLPRRELINTVYLAMAIAMGLNCPIVNAAKARPAILAADLLTGRDEYAARFLQDYRREQAAAESGSD
ncbi:MAG TPA: pterin-binding protein [Chloroflexi bacterium]|nr:pterin-binding protein [Chloroflexota bacterium]